MPICFFAYQSGDSAIGKLQDDPYMIKRSRQGAGGNDMQTRGDIMKVKFKEAIPRFAFAIILGAVVGWR